jgi:membrane protease YdiL (CAAX protease family)
MRELWQRLPVIVRAIVAGSLVSTIGHMPTGALFFANLQFWPAIPWSTPPIVLCLWFFWQYLDGRWWPASTSQARRRDLGARPLSPRVWRWSLLAGGLAMASLFALHFVAARLTPGPYVVYYDLFRRLPPVSLVLSVITLSAVAGIVEEAGFRGYMHGPIERRHGPIVAIIVVTIVFTLAHFTDLPQMTADRIFFVTAASVGYGIMVHMTGSILPGLVLHAAGDAASLLVLWTLWSIGGPGRSQNIGWSFASTDPRFWIYVAEAVLLAAASIWAFGRLAMTIRSERGARERMGSGLWFSLFSSARRENRI